MSECKICQSKVKPFFFLCKSHYDLLSRDNQKEVKKRIYGVSVINLLSKENLQFQKNICDLIKAGEK